MCVGVEVRGTWSTTPPSSEKNGAPHEGSLAVKNAPVKIKFDGTLSPFLIFFVDYSLIETEAR